MNFLDQLRSAVADFLRPRNELISTSKDLADYLLKQGSETWAGINLTTEQALEYAPLGTAVRVLSEGLGQLPFHIFQRGADDPREREIARDFHLQRLFRRPNGWQSGPELREWFIRHASTTGDAFALINRNTRRGEINELLPLHPGRVQVKQNSDWSLTYTVASGDGSPKDFPQSRIFHFRGPSEDGYTGLSFIRKHRQAIALGIAQDQCAANLFGKGAILSGLISFPNALSDKAWKRNLDAWKERLSGPSKTNTLSIMDNGAKFENMMMTSEASQLLESRKLQRAMVVAFLRVPLHMAGDLDKATFSNIENLARQAVDYTFMPWGVRFESAVEQQLMTAAEREIYFAKHNFAALLRGNAAERADFYNAGVDHGWMTRNEVRDKEDLSPIEGGDEITPAANIVGTPAAPDNRQRQKDRNSGGSDNDQTNDSLVPPARWRGLTASAR